MSKFITFEGADGAGKTTQIDFVKEFLSENNIEYIVTREPGAGRLGEKIRDILLNYDGDITPLSELLLYMADRAQHVKKFILPYLEAGMVVLCDRYIDSSVAYQGFARGLDIEQIKLLNKISTDNLVPDITFLFDIETKTAMQRVGNNKDRMEKEGIEFHKKLCDGYRILAKENPERFVVIDANKSVEEVKAQTLRELKQRLF